MDYQRFINTVAKHQSSRIKAVPIPESCSPGSIPIPFHHFIPEIINILDRHFDEISYGASAVGIFGFQMAGAAIKSTDNSKNSDNTNHLCAVLYYLPISSKSNCNISDWSCYKSVVIDFTSGVVMDDNCYLHKILNQGTDGKIYGKLNIKRLLQAWQNFYSNSLPAMTQTIN